MFVKSIMIPKHRCITAQRNETLRSALQKLDHYQIHGMPIINGERYEGILTKYHIYESYFLLSKQKDEYLDSTYVQDIATHQEVFLVGEEAFEKTLLDLRDFPLLAVCDSNRRILGVMTRSDVLEQFQSAFGVNRPG